MRLDLFRAVPIAMAILAVPVWGQQTGTSALPQFEVATVKPANVSQPRSSDIKVYSGGRIVLPGKSLKSLIVTAYHISAWQLSGGEPWMENDRYDIEAKAPALDPPATYDVRHTWWQIEDPRLRAMLQSLLIERFHLRLVPQSTTGHVYLLEVGGKTALLHPTEAATATHPFGGEGFSGDIGHGGDRWVIYNTSMAQLAQFAEDVIEHRPVIDKTRLTGYFDAKWTQTLTDSNNYDGMDSFPMMLQALGLKLTKSTGTVETFLIEHADPPSPN
jgi:uncharacterized protein (TIGR03435 family)